MSSVYFRIEAYGFDNYGCPELDLMGYNNIEELKEACWKKYMIENTELEETKE